MPNLNKCTFIGHVGREPEVKTLGSGIKVANFSLGVTDKYKDEQGQYVSNTEWNDCVAFGPLADLVEKYVNKGTPIYIESKKKTETYTAKDGSEKKAVKFIISSIVLLGSKPQNNKQDGGFDF